MCFPLQAWSSWTQWAACRRRLMSGYAGERANSRASRPCRQEPACVLTKGAGLAVDAGGLHPLDDKDCCCAHQWLPSTMCPLHLCRWVQAECRGLSEADAPEVNPLLQQAAAALRERPVSGSCRPFVNAPCMPQKLLAKPPDVAPGAPRALKTRRSFHATCVDSSSLFLAGSRCCSATARRRWRRRGTPPSSSASSRRGQA